MTATSTTTETAIPTTGTWSLDQSHTQVGFAVKHLMISTVKGRFRDVAATVRLDPASATPDISATIQVASITTGDEKRDDHLRSADFFMAEQHPVMEFRGTRIDGNIDTRFKLHGELTIRGTTRPVTLDVTTEGQATDPWGNQRIGFTATTKISRKDFGLEWNVALETGGVLVGDDVRITIETEVVKQ